MARKTIATGFSGENNIIDPARLVYDPKTGISELTAAVNCDIDDSLAISRRQKLVLIEAGAFHSLWSDGVVCFVAKDRTSDAAIYNVTSALALVGVHDTLTKSTRISYTRADTLIFYLNGTQAGVLGCPASTWINYYWPGVTHLGANTYKEFRGLTVGEHCEVFNHRMLVALGRWLRVSEEDSYGKFRGTNYKPFETDIRMMKRVDGGLWISDSKATWFIPNANKFEDYRRIHKSPFPAHKYSASHQLVDTLPLEIPGDSAIWSSNAGLCIGSADGQLFVTTEKKLIYPQGTTGATVVDGLNVINLVGTTIKRTNMRRNATSTYTTGTPVVNSMCKFGDVILLAADTGLYKLADTGTEAVDAYATLFPSDFGERTGMRCSQAYLTGRLSGFMGISLTGNDKTTIGPYTVTGKTDEGIQTRRATTGQGLLFTHGQFKIANVSGSDFMISGLSAEINAEKHSRK